MCLQHTQLHFLNVFNCFCLHQAGRKKAKKHISGKCCLNPFIGKHVIQYKTVLRSSAQFFKHSILKCQFVNTLG